jgi:hypothetical protein
MDADETSRPEPVNADPLNKNPEFHGMFRNENCSPEHQYGSGRLKNQAKPG